MGLENLPFILQGLITGIISFASPCSLAILPSFIAFLTSSAKNRSESFILSLLYTIGFALTYAIIFTLISVGLARFSSRFYFDIIAGALTILLSFYLFFTKEIQHFFRQRKMNKATPQNILEEPEKNHTTENILVDPASIESNEPNFQSENSSSSEGGSDFEKRSFYGKMVSAFSLGFTSGGASNTCASLIFAAFITLASSQSPTVMLYMMIFYALGLMVPFILIGVAVGELNNRLLAKMIRYSSIVSRVFAVLLFWFGLEILLAPLGYDFILRII